MEVFETLDLKRIRAALDRGEVFWVDRLNPPDAEVAEAGAHFGLHPLSVEDSQHFGQRPKLDDYPDSVLLVFYGARSGADGLPEPVETHLYITARAIVTVRRDDLPGVSEACRRMRERTITTSEAALYGVLHALTDSFVEPLRAVDDELDRLEDQALDDPEPELRRRLLEIKHSLLVLRQVVEPQRDLMASRRQVIADLPGFTDDSTHDYLRDIHDHLARTTQQIESVHELVVNALDLYLSTVSNRLNEVMKRLTVVATIFLPLTFLTGFFGMNFGWLVRNISDAASFWLLGVGSTLAAGGAMWALSAKVERSAAAGDPARRRRRTVRRAGDPSPP